MFFQMVLNQLHSHKEITKNTKNRNMDFEILLLVYYYEILRNKDAQALCIEFLSMNEKVDIIELKMIVLRERSGNASFEIFYMNCICTYPAQNVW